MRQRTDRQATNSAEVNKGKMGIFSCMLVAAATTLCFMGQAFGLECAVCLPPDENASIAKEIRRLFPDDHSNLIGCHQVNGTDEHAIVKTCPEHSASCHIQKTKEWIAKTCSKISVDDCKTANRVKYCYCKTNRCNMQDLVITTTASSSEKVKATTSAATTTTSADDAHSETTTQVRPADSARSVSSLRKLEFQLIFSCLLLFFFNTIL